MEMNTKGFSLYEIILAALILAIAGSGIASAYLLQGSTLAATAHRLEAANYAESIAETLILAGVMPMGMGEPKLSLGEHNESTDPAVCALPDSFFKKELKGKVRYIVEDRPLTGNQYETVVARRVEVIVEWQEKKPGSKPKKEELFFAALFYCK